MNAPFLQTYLRMRPIEWQDWFVVVLTTLTVYLYEMNRKNCLRRVAE